MNKDDGIVTSTVISGDKVVTLIRIEDAIFESAAKGGNQILYAYHKR
jgi:hypothetical protein